MYNQLVQDALIESCTFNSRSTEDKTVVFIALGNDLAKFELYDYLISQSKIKAIVVEEPGNKLVQKLNDRQPNLHSIVLSLESRASLTREVIEKIDEKLHELNVRSPDAVMTYWDDAVALAARVATHYQVPTNSIESIDLAHDKSLTRKFLSQNGFASPNSCVIRGSEQLTDEFVKSLNYPIILKPVYGAASIGVMKVLKPEDLVSNYNEVQRILKQCYKEADLMGLVFDDSPFNTDSNDTTNSLTHVIIEEFLNGREFDCDLILQEGEVVWAELCDDWEYVPPHFVELGSNVPTTTSKDREEAVKDYAIRVVKAMGLTMGVHHVEVIDDVVHGPVLVECNPRMGGGPVRMNHLLVHRTDLAIEALYSALGMKSVAAVTEHSTSWRTVSNATACLYATESGVLKVDSQTLLNQVIGDYSENVIVARSCASSGTSLKGWHAEGCHPSGLGLLSVSVHGTVEEAKLLVNSLREQFLSLVNQNLD